MTTSKLVVKSIKRLNRRSKLKDIQAVLVPACLIQAVLHKFHDQHGHLGFTTTLQRIRERYYWPGMYSDILHYVSTCDQCQKRKSAKSTATPGNLQLMASRPLQVLCTDFVQITSATSEHPYYCVLTITDMFTRFTRLYPCRDQTAVTFNSCLSDWIRQFTYPERILSDNCAAFTAAFTQAQLSLASIAQSLIAPLNPKGNSIAERINRPILDMLLILARDMPHTWPSKLGQVESLLNSRPHASLDGITPLEALTGVQPRSEDDFILPFQDDDTTPVTRLENLQSVRNYIRKHLSTKYVQSPHVEAPRYKPDDKVMVKFHLNGRAKTDDKFYSALKSSRPSPTQMVASLRRLYVHILARP
eukprot:TRINITY_DN12487_c1_g5_i1.p3 TRINITY_DN12487_c1_g5~~TRINITY_DN12487_c1_g5_i1.p3  ORF type:complete len:360 (+),score=44.39 TRINITY_DN12487_c1_g5_i1:2197-3276(+)